MNELECPRPLACPVCDKGLELEQRSFVCPQRHTFDMAREGYVNLLLSKGKRPKIQGDSRAMLQARRRFLEAGHYAPLAQAVISLVVAQVQAKTAVSSIADIGCGEGWYMGQLQQPLATSDSCFFGVDMSKTAVRMAAKRYSSAQFVVADVWHKLPFVDDSISVLLNLFAPRNPAEFARALAPGGLLLIVIPQPHHLQQLRQQLGLLNIEAEKQKKIVAQMADLFKLQAVHPLAIEMDLADEALANLVQMTPNYWHWTTAVQEKLTQLSHTRITAAFDILTFTNRA